MSSGAEEEVEDQISKKAVFGFLVNPIWSVPQTPSVKHLFPRNWKALIATRLEPNILLPGLLTSGPL